MTQTLIKVNIIQLDGKILTKSFSKDTNILIIKNWIIENTGVNNFNLIEINNKKINNNTTINELIDETLFISDEIQECVDFYMINLVIEEYWLVNTYTDCWDDNAESWVDTSSNKFIIFNSKEKANIKAIELRKKINEYNYSRADILGPIKWDTHTSSINFKDMENSISKNLLYISPYSFNKNHINFTNKISEIEKLIFDFKNNS